MKKGLFALLLGAALLSGCASVPMESAEKSNAAKEFKRPSPGKAGLYIYRSGSFGGALKKDVFVNGKCIGETAPNVFFYEEVAGGREHKISTESEFSPNDLIIKARAGVHYFIEQYIKMGVFVGGAGVKRMEAQAGKKAVSELELAQKGTCSQ